MVTARICTIVLSILLAAHVQADDTNTTESCTQLYEKGVEAYLENRYEDCVNNFEKALVKYRAYRKQLNDCRLKCKNEAEQSEPLYPVNVDNLLFYESALRQTLCLMTCEYGSPAIMENHHINLEVENLFERLKPYEYLHLCYYQTKDLKKAGSSAFTYLVAHPNNKIMKSNLKYYLSKDGLNEKDIVNYEAKDYVYMYVYGTRAYDNQQWEDVVNYMEDSLTSYLHEEEECRAHCEGPFDHGWYPDYIPALSNHFTVCLRCKHRCQKKLASLNGEIHDDLLPSHYHYLQYAYFKLGNLKAACQAVASYLLFFPNDETMLSNKEFYSKTPKVQEDYYRPREEALHYFQRLTYESRLLKFISKTFSTISPGSKKVIVDNTVDI